MTVESRRRQRRLRVRRTRGGYDEPGLRGARSVRRPRGGGRARGIHAADGDSGPRRFPRRSPAGTCSAWRKPGRERRPRSRSRWFSDCPRRRTGMRPADSSSRPLASLAQQIGKAVGTYGAASSIEVVVIHGGTRLGPERDELAFGCDVLVATPGRLLDHLKRGFADLSAVEVLIIDEADRMLDMGFIDDVKEIVAATPSSRQTLLFSATMPGGVKWLAHELMTDPRGSSDRLRDRGGRHRPGAAPRRLVAQARAAAPLAGRMAGGPGARLHAHTATPRPTCPTSSRAAASPWTACTGASTRISGIAP